jgi:hypothetical protein
MSTITFRNEVGPAVEVLKISKEGVWANPNVPVDQAAQTVLNAIDRNIKLLVEKAVEQEREACAQICDAKADAEYATGKVDHNEMGWTQACAEAIRARGER